MTAPTTPTSPVAPPAVTPVPSLPPGDTHDGFFLWGAPKAGKSGFIGALYGLSRGDDVERWTAHPKDCDDPHTQAMVLRAHEELSERRNTKTGVRDMPYRPLRLTLRKMKSGRQVGELRVALVDPAGEFSVDPTHRLSSAGQAAVSTGGDEPRRAVALRGDARWRSLDARSPPDPRAARGAARGGRRAAARPSGRHLPEQDRLPVRGEAS